MTDAALDADTEGATPTTGPPTTGVPTTGVPTTAEIARLGREVLDRVGEAVVEMRAPLELALATILAGGHVLFEDVPGLGKTLAARALAAAVGLDFRRLQCTPDLLPADITGSFVYSPATGSFDFRPGPIFTGLFLADEINRTAPKTQSALLEAMAEGQVTVEGQTFPLPRPFHLIATSNPIEFEGTYALPEAQLDRFMVRLAVGYPSPAGERAVLTARLRREREAVDVARVVDAETLAAMQRGVERVRVDEDVVAYCVDLAAATRSNGLVDVGASPRGSQGLMLVARGLAVLRGRDFVTPDDVKAIAVPVLAHRITLTTQAWANGVDARAIVRGLVDVVPGPPVVGGIRDAPTDAPTDAPGPGDPA